MSCRRAVGSLTGAGVEFVAFEHLTETDWQNRSNGTLRRCISGCHSRAANA
jgi:hypothetical protein